jgi:hypothetical protein
MQIIRIKGPDQIFIDTGTPGSSAIAGEASASSYNKFTCELNGIASGDVKVTFLFFDNRGVSMGKEETVTVKKDNITKDNKFYFTITPGQTLSGSSIYIHAIITNDTTDPDNVVSFKKSSYHETIKHVQVCAEKKINLVYWSGDDQIDEKKMAEQENVKNKAGANDKRYIHIKTTGMYSDVVELTISVGDATPKLQKINVPLHRNHQVVPVSMKDALARYCSIKGLSGEKARGLTLNIKAAVTFKDDKYTLEGPDNTMELEGDKPADKETSAVNGAVLVTVDKSNNYEEKPVRYTDFLIGYICHIEGVGKLAKANNKIEITDEKQADYTVYPFHVYEIILSDLVNCGLVTLDEAAYLTTKDNDMKNLEEKEILKKNFNKISNKISSDKTLLSLFQDTTNNNRAKSSAIRKVLTQVCHKPTKFSEQDFICRDAWEIVSSKNVNETKEDERQKENGETETVIIKREGKEVTKIYPRPDEHRYSKHKECPFGEFFLNYLPGGNFKVYASRNIGDRVINEYKEDKQTGRPDSPNPIERGEIAIHQGGANASVGCLTFNTLWNGGNHLKFNDLIYPKKVNISKLNFLCIDERNAVKVPNDIKNYTGNDLKNVSDISSSKKITFKKNDNFNFKRYYDLVKPKNRIPAVKETETVKEKKTTK